MKLLTRLIKMFTYLKRKKRIEDKIFQRITRKYPRFPLYDRHTGKDRFDQPQLEIKICKDFDASNGKVIYYFKRYTLKLNSEVYYGRWNLNRPFYEFDKNGKILDKTEFYEYEIYLNELHSNKR